ncbi:MAG TPA: glycosyl hydrolase family 28 protein [Candidatus Lokiarchaeia archaeon]|nr:glycosyl hydrolase family 28 protein [Candidatus Lokiarchaeia archaeon]
MSIPIYNVADHGATGNGESLDSPAIQAAIDACSASGGGTVLIPRGNYICGTIHLLNNITLEISGGACLHYSPREEDFDEPEELSFNPNADIETSYFRFALIHAEGVEAIAIQGKGKIDGKPYHRAGPKPIALKSCNHITIKDITIEDAPNYNISMIDCEQITIDGVFIHGGLADGIDFDNCRYGMVTNCYIDAYDDAICLKTSPALGVLSTTEDIAVTNCTIGTSCFALKIGTETSGDCHNIAFSNCTLFARRGHGGFLGGIALEAVDGSHVDNVVISNITMHGARCPIFLRVGNRGRGQPIPTPGSMENVAITNIVARDAILPCIIAGIPDKVIEHLHISNVIIDFADAGPDALAKADLKVPECIPDYPEPGQFKPLPAWGIYCRHAKDITLSGLQLRQEIFDPRAGIVLDDIHDLVLDARLAWKVTNDQDDLEKNQAAAWFHQSSNIKIRECEAIAVPARFKITGDASLNVQFLPGVVQEKETSIIADANIEEKEIIVM